MQRSTMWFFCFLWLSTLACEREKISPAEIPNTDYPRILLLRGEEEAIKARITTDPTWKQLHEAILAECDKMLGQAPIERVLIGRRLLDKSRTCLKRVFYLSYAHRLTGYEKYKNRAELEMLAAAGFSDWNPSHFLDVAEMTMALAIGYDWLYDQLKAESRKTIREAIVQKGLNPSLKSENNAFLRATHNWNQVCNAGMAFGALAVAHAYPELAQTIIDRAVETIHLPMEGYQPDGAYPEGYGYWGYGTTFNVLFLSALEKAYGTDEGLAQTPGFLETAAYLAHMSGATALCFNYSDCNLGGNLNPAMFWFAQKKNDPSLLWVEKRYLQQNNFSKFTGIGYLPAVMIWGKDIPLDNITEPAAKVWVGQGANPVCLLRSSWSDPQAVYLGFKAGSPSVNHGHMDIGSFIMEANGERWASDLGLQNYESLESKGIQVFGRDQNAQRWTIFRMNNFSHNTLTVDGQLQQVSGYAKIDRYSDDPGFSFAISDISSVYKDQLAGTRRGVALVEGKYAVIRDEIKTLNKTTTIRWQILTEAAVTTGNREAILTKNGKKLYLKVEGPTSLQMKTWSTAPTTDYDAPNPGTTLVGFECEIPANTSEVFQVVLVPDNALDAVTPLEKNLDDWK